MALILEIKAESRAATRQIRRATTKTRADVKKLEKTSVASANRVQAAWGGVAQILGPLGIGLSVITAIRGMKQIIIAASDLEESLNKVREVFGLASASIEEFAQTSARALGASREEALAMTGEIGGLLVSFGFTQREAAKMSENIVQLAADMGSFNNVPTMEALMAIRSALVGASIPMIRFGSDTRQTRLSQIALEKGLTFTKGAMDAQTRAIVALEAIYIDTRQAQGDFGRTSDALANSIKILEGTFEDITTEVGSNFVPIVTAGTIAITEMLTAAGDPDSKIGTFIDKLEGIGEAFLKINPFAKAYVDWLNDIAKSSEKLTEAGPASKEGLAAWGEFNELVKQNAVEMEASRLEAELLAFVIKESLIPHSAEALPLNVELLELYNEEVAAQERLNEQLNNANAFLREGAAVIPDLPENIQIASDSAQELQINTEGIANELIRAGQAGDNLLAIFLKLAIQSALLTIPGGGATASIFAGFFQHGGSFQVPGSGGADSQLVAFRGTPGEQVTISPPGVTNNNTRNVGPVSLNFPNVRTIDKFTLQTEILPLMQEILEDGSTLNATGSLSDR